MFPIIALVVLSGCSRGGDEVYSREDGKLVGTVIETGNHAFGNGLEGPAIHFRRADGSDVWASKDTFDGAFEVRPKK